MLKCDMCAEKRMLTYADYEEAAARALTCTVTLRASAPDAAGSAFPSVLGTAVDWRLVQRELGVAGTVLT